jgi:hypothetical protein
MKHVVSHGESFPSIAEHYGHPGEWQVIAGLNAPPVLVIDGMPVAPHDPGAPMIGAELELPAEWDPEYTPRPPRPPSSGGPKAL